MDLTILITFLLAITYEYYPIVITIFIYMLKYLGANFRQVLSNTF